MHDLGSAGAGHGAAADAVHRVSSTARRTSAAILAVAALTLTACSNSGGSGASSDPAQPPASSQPGGASILTTAKTLTDRFIAGTNKTPAGAPVAAQTGKKVFVVSCGQNVLSCSGPTKGAVEAAHLLGWKVTVLDEKANPATQGPLIDQAVAAGAQGIMIVGNDCSISQAALQRAKKAGVQVDDIYGADCSEPYAAGAAKGPSLFTDVPFAEYSSGPTYFNAWAAAKADYIINRSGGKAKVLNFDVTDAPSLHAQSLAFADEMAKCSGCKVYDVPFSAADLGPKLQQVAQQAPLKHPDADTVVAPVDGIYFAGIMPGIKASGRASKLFTVAGEGEAPTVQLVAAGQVGAVVAYSNDWAGYALVDTLNSMFAGQPPRNSGLGWQIIDKDHNPAAGNGVYTPTIDYKSVYKKLWGLA